MSFEIWCVTNVRARMRTGLFGEFIAKERVEGLPVIPVREDTLVQTTDDFAHIRKRWGVSGTVVVSRTDPENYYYVRPTTHLR